MIPEGDPGRFTVWGKRNGVKELYRVCETHEEVRLTKDEYKAAGYQVTIIERIAGTSCTKSHNPSG